MYSISIAFGAGASFVIVLLLSIKIGFLCAVYKDGWFDKMMRSIVFVTTAMPPYWVGLLLMWAIGVKFGWLPTNGNGTWKHLILPAFTVALSYISTYIRLIRNNMLENMKQDYVLYANVRGLSPKSIWVKHVLKNSMCQNPYSCILPYYASSYYTLMFKQLFIFYCITIINIEVFIMANRL